MNTLEKVRREWGFLDARIGIFREEPSLLSCVIMYHYDSYARSGCLLDQICQPESPNHSGQASTIAMRDAWRDEGQTGRREETLKPQGFLSHCLQVRVGAEHVALMTMLMTAGAADAGGDVLRRQG